MVAFIKLIPVPPGPCVALLYSLFCPLVELGSEAKSASATADCICTRPLPFGRNSKFAFDTVVDIAVSLIVISFTENPVRSN